MDQSERGAGQDVDGESAVDSKWQSDTNWSGDTEPTANSSLRFAGTTRLINTNDFAAGTQFAGLTFNAGAGAFTLSGNKVNLLGNVVNNSANTQTIGLPLALDGSSRAFNALGSSLTVSVRSARPAGRTV